MKVEENAYTKKLSFTMLAKVLVMWKIEEREVTMAQSISADFYDTCGSGSSKEGLMADKM